MDTENTNAPRVLRLDRNEKGRDFIVGDIHGAFELVVEAMKQANFDPEIDRILSVGDLIDRHPDSRRCARFLAQPYVNAVRGNHEDMLLGLYAGGTPDSRVLQVAAQFNGFEWWLGVPQNEQEEILAAIRKLPLAIELDTERGSVGLIHADVPVGMAWGEFIAKLEDGESLVVQTCLWGRDRIKKHDTSGVLGVGRVFVGHTPQWGGMTRLGNVYAVDSGAVFGYLGFKHEGCLTMAQAITKTAVLSAPRQETGLVDLRGEKDINGDPFGQYAHSLDDKLVLPIPIGGGNASS